MCVTFHQFFPRSTGFACNICPNTLNRFSGLLGKDVRSFDGGPFGFLTRYMISQGSPTMIQGFIGQELTWGQGWLEQTYISKSSASVDWLCVLYSACGSKPLEAQKERERLLEKAQKHQDRRFLWRERNLAQFLATVVMLFVAWDASPRRSMSSVRPLLSTSMGPQFGAISLRLSVLM